MAFTLNHLHIKSPDPVATAQWYIDTLGASRVGTLDVWMIQGESHGGPPTETTTSDCCLSSTSTTRPICSGTTRTSNPSANALLRNSGRRHHPSLVSIKRGGPPWLSP